MPSSLSKRLLLLAVFAATASAQDATLVPLPKASLSHLLDDGHTSLLPPGARITVTPHQQFTMSAPKAASLAIIPLLYADLSTPQYRTYPEVCGTIFAEENQPAYFVPIIGILASPGYLSSPCAGTIAMGKALDPGPRPRLIVIFAVTSMHGDDFALPVLLAWNIAANKYELDIKGSESLARPHMDTVAQVRRLLQQQHR